MKRSHQDMTRPNIFHCRSESKGIIYEKGAGLHSWDYLPPEGMTDAIQAPSSFGLRVWKKTVPGPVNRQTNPSPAAMEPIMPPLERRSMSYLHVHATKSVEKINLIITLKNI
jgi:hypothetical protein